MSAHSTMKLRVLLISLVFFLVVLVQNIGARPYPQESTSSSWFGDWLGISPSDYGVDLEGFVPGLESISEYGKESMKIAEDIGKNALQAVNTFQENLVKNVVDSYSPIIAYGSETIKSGIEAVLTVIEQVIDGIRNLSSVGDDILTSLHMTREQLGSVLNLVDYLPE